MLTPAAPTLTELVLPTVEELAVVAAKTLGEAALAAAAAAALPLALILGLLLASSTPAGGPGIPQPHLLPASRQELRLQELLAKYATGTLTTAEEAELLALLATVRGIHVQSLQELPTLPSNSPSENARPGGFVTRINLNDEPENQLALSRENESAVILAQAGYKVEQNPTIGGTTRNLDYLIEGRVVDCYAPTNSKPRAIANTLEGKIKKGQANRFILNLEDSAVDIKALHQQLQEYPVVGLQEIIIIKQNKVIPFFP